LDMFDDLANCDAKSVLSSLPLLMVEASVVGAAVVVVVVIVGGVGHVLHLTGHNERDTGCEQLVVAHVSGSPRPLHRSTVVDVLVDVVVVVVGHVLHLKGQSARAAGWEQLDVAHVSESK
jgi:hypothetical protein